MDEYPTELELLKLNEIYNQIPQVICSRCAQCCSNTIIYSIEYENIKRYIQNFSYEFKNELQAKFALNIATQFKQWKFLQRENIEEMEPWEVCAFLEPKEKKCLIFSYRPFACRIFGLEDESRCYTKSIRMRERERERENRF